MYLRVLPVVVLTAATVATAADLPLEAVVTLVGSRCSLVVRSNILDTEVDPLVAVQVEAGSQLRLVVDKLLLAELLITGMSGEVERSRLFRTPFATAREASGLGQSGGSEGNED